MDENQKEYSPEVKIIDKDELIYLELEGEKIAAGEIDIEEMQEEMEKERQRSSEMKDILVMEGKLESIDAEAYISSHPSVLPRGHAEYLKTASVAESEEMLKPFVRKA